MARNSQKFEAELNRHKGRLLPRAELDRTNISVGTVRTVATPHSVTQLAPRLRNFALS